MCMPQTFERKRMKLEKIISFIYVTMDVIVFLLLLVKCTIVDPRWVAPVGLFFWKAQEIQIFSFKRLHFNQTDIQTVSVGLMLIHWSCIFFLERERDEDDEWRTKNVFEISRPRAELSASGRTASTIWDNCDHWHSAENPGALFYLIDFK